MYICFIILPKRETQNYEKRLNKIFICMSKLIYPYQNSINETFDFINRWLPKRYTGSVNILLKKSKDPDYIRKVKNRKLQDEAVIDALYKVSLFNKIQVETEI